MTMTVDIGTLITHTAKVRGGRPCIAGAGVTVQRVVGWYKRGLGPEEIADELEHLTLAQVYAALAYYHANRDEIEMAIAADEAEADRLEKSSDAVTRENAWDLLETLTGTIEAPPDWASEHDHYLYGTPKRKGEAEQ